MLFIWFCFVRLRTLWATLSLATLASDKIFGSAKYNFLASEISKFFSIPRSHEKGQKTTVFINHIFGSLYTGSPLNLICACGPRAYTKKYILVPDVYKLGPFWHVVIYFTFAVEMEIGNCLPSSICRKMTCEAIKQQMAQIPNIPATIRDSLQCTAKCCKNGRCKTIQTSSPPSPSLMTFPASCKGWSYFIPKHWNKMMFLFSIQKIILY